LTVIIPIGLDKNSNIAMYTKLTRREMRPTTKMDEIGFE
jgi:hypothetical protein